MFCIFYTNCYLSIMPQPSRKAKISSPCTPEATLLGYRQQQPEAENPVRHPARQGGSWALRTPGRNLGFSLVEDRTGKLPGGGGTGAAPAEPRCPGESSMGTAAGAETGWEAGEGTEQPGRGPASDSREGWGKTANASPGPSKDPCTCCSIFIPHLSNPAPCYREKMAAGDCGPQFLEGSQSPHLGLPTPTSGPAHAPHTCLPRGSSRWFWQTPGSRCCAG